jgi:tetratricopeptide (TPR) repeat protein
MKKDSGPTNRPEGNQGKSGLNSGHSAMSSKATEPKEAGEKYVACDLCGGEKYDVLWQEGRFGKSVQNVICRDCGLVYINPRPLGGVADEFYVNEYFSEYYGYSKPTGSYILDALRKAKNRYKLFGEFLSNPSPRVLEIGSSVGAQLRVILDNVPNAEVVGIEPSIEFSGFAQEELGLNNVYQGLWQDHLHRFEQKTFDLIIVSHVLEHFESPREFLTHIRNLLKDSGVIFIEIPDIMFPYKGLSFFLQAPHLFTFCKETLEKLLRISGFEIIRSARGDYYFMRVVAKPSQNADILLTDPEADLIEKIKTFISAYDSLWQLLHSKPGENCSEPKEILEHYRIEQDCDAEGLYEILGQVHFRTEGFEKAQEYFEGVLNISPDSPQAHQNLAEVYIAKDELDQAEDIVRKGLEKTYLSLNLQNLLGVILIKKKLFAEAEDQFMKILDADEKRISPYYWLAEIYDCMDEVPKAMEILRRGIETNPDAVFLIYHMGNRLMEAERYDEAIDLLRHGLEKDPDAINILDGLGTALYKHGDIEEAEQYLARLMELNEARPHIYLMLAEIYAERNDDDNYLHALEQAYSLDIREKNIVFKLMNYYLERGMLSKLEDVWEEAIYHHQTDRDIQYLLFDYFCAANMYSQMNRLDLVLEENKGIGLLRLSFGRSRLRFGQWGAVRIAARFALFGGVLTGR